MRCLWSCMVSVGLIGCGGGGHSAPPDAAVDADPFGSASSTYPAYPVATPQAVSLGGPVMANVRVVPIFYTGDSNQAPVTDFLGKLAASTYWAQMTGEYGVTGALTIDTAVTLAASAPATTTDADIQTFLAGQLDGTHAEYGAVDAATLARTIYLLHLPSTTTGTGPTPPGDASCTGFVGYHTSFALGSSRAIYAVVYDCPPPPALSTTLQFTTAVTIHELVEAATDPLVETMPAYHSANQPTAALALQNGPELGDLCQLASTQWWAPADLGYTIQRSWSNASAMGFHDPCVPVPPDEPVFFAAVPQEPDTLDAGNGVTLKGTQLAVGQSKTIDVDLVSSGPTGGDWMITPVDVSGGAIQLSLDRASGQNGNRVHLTIKAVSRPSTGVALYRLRSTLGTAKTVWWGAAGITP